MNMNGQEMETTVTGNMEETSIPKLMEELGHSEGRNAINAEVMAISRGIA